VLEKSIFNILEQLKNDKKDILVIFDDKKINKHLKERITEIINTNKADNMIDFYLTSQIERSPQDKYNVVLELPFLSFEQTNVIRKLLVQKLSYDYKNQYFSFVNINFTEIFEIFKMKLQNINRINIVNICSNYYSNKFLNSNKNQLHDKLREYLEGKLVYKNETILSKSYIMSIEEKKKVLFEKYDKNLICDIVELIKNNSDLKKLIFIKFIKSKEHLFWKNKNVNVSLINGKKGYITVKMVPPTKQREE